MKLPKTLKELNKFIDRAEQAGACETDVAILHSFKTIDEFYDHNKVRYWLYWYSRTVIRGRWPEAEEYIKKAVSWAPVYAYWAGLHPDTNKW